MSTGTTYKLDTTLLANVPAELTQRPQWVLWKYDVRPGATKPTKVPVQVTGKHAKSNDPATWTTFDAAVKAYEATPGKWTGIGYVFAAEDPYCGIDLDNCLDESGSLEGWAIELFKQIGAASTYGEISPSGRGLKVITRASLNGSGRRVGGQGLDTSGAIEMYDRSRYFTITGNRYHKCDTRIDYGDEGIAQLYESLKPERLQPVPPSTVRSPSNNRHPATDRLSRCLAFIAKLPDSISGQGGHDKCLRAACETVRFDLTEAEALRVMQHWSLHRSGKEPWSDKDIRHKLESAEKLATRGERLKEVHKQRYDKGQKPGSTAEQGHNGNSGLISLNDPSEPNTKDDAEHNGELVQADGYLKIECPEVVPLDGAALPKLPMEVFTGPAYDMINAVAEHTETPPECGAATLLAALGTVCQKKLSVCIDPGYCEPVNNFMLVSMEAGTRKSNAQSPFIKPLLDWDEARAGPLADVIAKSESARKTIEARLARMRAEAAKAKGVDFNALVDEIAKVEAAMPVVRELPQLLTQDVTPENLPSIMAANGEAMGLFSDEGGWLETIAGRYSNGIANLDVVLQAHSGSLVRVNRRSRPPLILRNPALSIGLVVQPDVVRGLASKPGFRGRGLLARFAYMLPNPNIGYRKLESVPLNRLSVDNYSKMIRALAEFHPRMDGTKPVPHVLSLDADAWTEWKAFQREVELWMRPGAQLEHARDWGGKLPGLVGRLAGLLHAAAFCSNPAAQANIDAPTMARAITLGRFLVPHALAAFDLMGADGSLEIARQLWRVVESPQRLAKVVSKGKDPLIITLRDMWHPTRNSYKSPTDVEPGVGKLVDHGYLVELPSSASGKYRPRKFRINLRAITPPDRLLV